MTVLRVVLDQLVAPADSELAEASLSLARALVAASPTGCRVEAIVPAGESALTQRIPGLGKVKASSLQRRELIAGWQLGVAPGIGGGLIHSPTLAAPLVRHDRVNDGDQTVVTVWDLRAWEAPAELARGAVAWQRGMLRRAARFADAVVAPTFAIAQRLDEIAGLGERVRVIPGAPVDGFAVPTDATARTRDLSLPERFIATSGTLHPSDGLSDALRAAAAGIEDGCDVVVFGAGDDEEAGILEVAEAAGVPRRHLHVHGALEQADRAALLGAAELFVATTTRSAWPWRIPEALALGVPVVATDTPSHREVLAEGGALASAAALPEAVAEALAEAERRRVLASDRGRAYSWQGAAERVWQLHAEL